jgi:hypothetical protein
MCVLQDQSVIRSLRRRDVREASRVHRAHQEIARTIPGEHPSSAIGARSRRGQPEDEQARPRIAKSRDGFAPVDILAVSGLLLARDAFAVRAQPFAAIASDDVTVDEA